ncbi:trypsin-like serine protease [Streptomyces sp. NA04227]|uniref:trypsin-like serine protease n=1 Tax=Streptomyces sp. NA04227 TaxID=2742136 RepID=UPI00158FB26C|nr:trypsin-like serine protease [Streptomyces sp. NA04227]QKW10043.1 trypsin-like serine protease [Streptomyces sp. NA04227]
MRRRSDGRERGAAPGGTARSDRGETGVRRAGKAGKWLGGIAVLASTVLLSAPLATAGAQTATPGPETDAVNPTDTLQVPEGPHAQIIGGEQTTVAEYPYIVAALREGGPRPLGQTCTGSVIGPRTILIAAHCKDGDGTKSFYYGADDLTKPEGGTKIEVESYTQHPKYQSPNGWQTGYDVAVVQTKQDIPVKDGQYAKFATSADSELSQPGKTGTAIGYGRVSDGENTNAHVKKASLPVVDGQNTCGSFGSFNGAYMVCAGYADGHDGICQGDSGGPLVVDGVVIGVASWVRTGCNSYGAWGRLTNEMGDWVKTQLPDSGAPTAAFTPNCSTTEPSCSFDATASKDGDGQIASYAWNFGDSTEGKGATPSHTYQKAGSYEVTLTVTDDAGKKGTVTHTVHAGVEEPSGEPPTPAFSVSCWYEACDFDASQSRDTDNDIASYAWKFGDGKTGTGVKSAHSYPAGQKNYTAELSVTDKGGNTATTSKQIQCWDFSGRAFCFSG